MMILPIVPTIPLAIHYQESAKSLKTLIALVDITQGGNGESKEMIVAVIPALLLKGAKNITRRKKNTNRVLTKIQSNFVYSSLLKTV